MPSLKPVVAAVAIALLGAACAWADCTNPTGKESETIYNGDYHTWQFCNGTSWSAMGSVFSVPWATNGSNVYYNGGNVGIGTSSPTKTLDVNGSIALSAYGEITPKDTTTGLTVCGQSTGYPNGGCVAFRGNDGGGGGTASNGLEFYSGGSERMRITSAGNVYIGAITGSGVNLETMRLVTAQDGLRVDVNHASNAGAGLFVNRQNSTGALALFYYSGSTGVGSITTNGSSTTYNTSSDRRLKENIADTGAGLAQLSEIKVRDFNFISDPSKTKVQGFIAQELYPIYPEAVSVGGSDPKKHPWSVDYGRLTPLLVKALQELKADNDNLRADFEAYKRTHP